MKHFRLTIGTRIMLVSTLVAIMIGGLLTYKAVSAQDALLRSEVERLGMAVGQGFASFISSSNIQSLSDLALNPQALSYISDLAKNEGFSHIVVMNRDGKAVLHSDSSRVGMVFNDETSLAEVRTEKPMTTSYTRQDTKETFMEIAVPLKVQGNYAGAVVVGVATSYFGDARSRTIQNALIYGAPLLLVALVVNFLLSIVIKKAIETLKNKLERVAAGDLTEQVAVKVGNDEIGDAINTFNHTLASLRSLVQTTVSVSQSVAASTEELSATSQEVSQATEQVAQTIGQIAAASEDDARNLEEASGKVDAIKDSVEKIYEAIQKTQQKTGETTNTVHQGSNALATTVQKIIQIEEVMNGIGRAIEGLIATIKQVSEVTATIRGFADQTNLLALNAAIEAARAGESGRGFAVVADEVRKLAESSTQAATEIAELLAGVQLEADAVGRSMHDGLIQVHDGTQLVNQSNQFLQNIAGDVHDITGHVSDVQTMAETIRQATEAIAKTMQTLAASSEESAAASQEVAASSEQQTASIKELADAAASLAKMADELSAASSKFRL